MLILETFDYNKLKLTKEVKRNIHGMYIWTNENSGEQIPKIKIWGKHTYHRRGKRLWCNVSFGNYFQLNYSYELPTYPNGKPIKLFT